MPKKTFFPRLMGDSTATFVGFVLACGVLLFSTWLADRNARRIANADKEMQTEALQQSLSIGLLTGGAGLLMLGAVFLLIRWNDRHQLRSTELLAEQKERLRTTLASIGDAVISTDCNGGVTYLNAVAESLTGWTNDEAVGLPLTQVFHIVNESTRQAVENPATRALKEGVIVGLANHTILIAKDGSERPIDDSASPIRCKDEQIVGCVLVFRDVTERKREEVARAERTRLVALRADVSIALALAQTTPMALHQCCDALVRSLDVAFARIWMLNDMDNVLNLQASAGLYTHLDGPHSRVPVGQFKIGRIASTRQPHLSNSVTDDPNVSDRAWAAREGMVAFAGYPLAIEGRVVGVMAIFARHTLSQGILTELAPLANGIAQYIERRRLEEQAREKAELTRSTLASIGDAVISTDRSGGITYMNVVAESLTGWTNAEATGQPLTQVFRIVNEWTRAAVENPAIRALKEGIIVGLSNHTILIAKDGSERPIDDSASPIRTEDGQIVGCVLVFRDVSERYREQDKLRASEWRFRAAVEAVSSLIWTNDAQGRMAGEQPGWGNFTGQTLEEYQGFGWAKAVHPDDAQPTIDAWNEAVAEQNFFVYEHRVRRYDGEWRNCTIRAVPVIDDRGVIREWVGVHSDITEQKRDVEKLRRSEERLRRVFDAQSVGMIEWDLERSVITAANEHFLNMMGYTAADVAAGRLDFRAMTPPEWTQRNDEGIAELRKSGRANAYEKEYFRKDGSRVPILIAGIRFEDCDRAGMSFIVDLSERKRAEKELRESEIRFRAMAENIQQLAWMARADGYIYWYNRRWYDYTGTRPDLQEGWGWESVHNPEVLPKVIERWKSSLATGEPFDMVFPLRGADGKFRPFLTRVMPVKDTSGRVVQWFGTNTDITEQQALEEDLRKITAELSEADRRKDEFLATLAHELRNPLAPIRNGLQILRIADDTATIERVRTMMERQLTQMVHLVDDLLDVSRISRGKLQLRKERVELATVLNDAVETSRPIIDAGGHTLIMKLPPDPIFLDADATRLGQIFSNLLNNAAKYSESGGRIELVASVEDEGRRMKVSIRDTGVGIPPEMLPKIFEMFTQVDRSLEKSQGGLGIGLTLVRRLVEMHDGAVEARSDGHGKGSEFIVRLPIASSEKPMANPTHVTQDPPHATALKVLVADDNEDSAITLSMILKILGSEVRTANDGMEAVEMATAFRPDVILLDIGMPRLNGYEACRRIREQSWGEKIVLVALTGWGQDEDKRRSQEAGFTHHMVKPIDPDALKKLLFPVRNVGTVPIAEISR